MRLGLGLSTIAQLRPASGGAGGLVWSNWKPRWQTLTNTWNNYK